jgi:hypothetical protein
MNDHEVHLLRRPFQEDQSEQVRKSVSACVRPGEAHASPQLLQGRNPPGRLAGRAMNERHQTMEAAATQLTDAASRAAAEERPAKVRRRPTPHPRTRRPVEGEVTTARRPSRIQRSRKAAAGSIRRSPVQGSWTTTPAGETPARTIVCSERSARTSLPAGVVHVLGVDGPNAAQRITGRPARTWSRIASKLRAASGRVPWS